MARRDATFLGRDIGPTAARLWFLVRYSSASAAMPPKRTARSALATLNNEPVLTLELPKVTPGSCSKPHMDRTDLVKRTDLEEETINEVRNILNAEFSG